MRTSQGTAYGDKILKVTPKCQAPAQSGKHQILTLVSRGTSGQPGESNGWKLIGTGCVIMADTKNILEMSTRKKNASVCDTGLKEEGVGGLVRPCVLAVSYTHLTLPTTTRV